MTQKMPLISWFRVVNKCIFCEYELRVIACAVDKQHIIVELMRGYDNGKCKRRDKYILS